MRFVLAAQGIYYLLSGLWPLLSMSTFEAVTGPKTDDWLVRTVGVLTIAIGATLVLAARPRAPARAALVLSGASALAYAAIDFWYGGTGQIRFVYVLDGIVEAVIVVLLVAFVLRTRAGAGRNGSSRRE